MYRHIIFCLFACINVLSCAQVQKVQKPVSSAIPVLKITNDTGSFILQISKLAIDVVVVGDISTTTFDIDFYNPQQKILEGEFEFPLADGQNISRYALDVNGSLREGVIVEKTKARVAFENTVRRNIDPGLIEKTKGNNFKTRIYPIPAKGFKRVVIGIEQQLAYTNMGLLYQLPLYTASPIRNFSIKVSAMTGSVKPALENNVLDDFSFTQWDNAWIAEYDKTGFTAENTISFSIPPADDGKELIFAERYRDQTYFFLNTAMVRRYGDKPKPSSILILWDISASAEKRNVKRELALIEKYVSSLQRVRITLVPFNIIPQAAEVFDIQNGDVSTLFERLQQFHFDGGTQLGAIDVKKYKTDEILLFSDGLSSFGKQEIMLSTVPVSTINSSPNADFSYLKFVAGQTHGNFIDMSKMDIAEAAVNLEGAPLQVIGTTYNETDFDEVCTKMEAHAGLSVTGIMKKSSGSITVHFGYGNTISESRSFTISEQQAGKYDKVKRLWAAMKIAALDLQYEMNRAAITALGKQFSIVTQNTSLLVLDRVEDYVQYNVIPPPELLEEYQALLRESLVSLVDDSATAIGEAVTAMWELKSWWGGRHAPVERISGSRFSSPTIVSDSETDTAAGIYEEGHMGIISDDRPTDAGKAIMSPTPDQEGQGDEAIMMRQDIQLEEVRQFPEKQKVTGLVAAPAINLRGWAPDAPYLTILEKTKREDYFEKYISLKADYHDQPSFFVDVSRFFFKKQNKELALQVLSNVCELKLEDAELLRIVANELLEAGETALAIETFREILKIREEEPQSYRDLALAYNDAGQYNEAVRLLYKILLTHWSDRFTVMKGIAINEMNAIISAHAEDVDMSRIDKQYIAAMPVDIRIVLSWSSDNADVDLWVTEPGKEKCYYEHRFTQSGGRISGDITQGYGPEEYIIKKAGKGEYLIEANLFGDSRQTLGGPITVKAELFTNFGTPAQKRKLINFRVTTNENVVYIGKLAFEQG